MKKNLKNLLLASVMFAVVLVPALSKAQEVSTEEADFALSLDVTDPMFNRYVDFNLLGWAWTEQDPVLLTDCALELAEAERILHRNLKTVKSGDLLKKAIMLASDQRNTETLDRIARYATATKQNDLLAEVTSAQRLAGEERAILPVFAVNLISMPMDKIAVLKALISEVDKARVNGNKAWLKAFAGEVPKNEQLTAMYEKQEIAALTKYAEESEKVTAESDEGAKDAEYALDRLAGEERQLSKQDKQAIAAIGLSIAAIIALKAAERNQGVGGYVPPQPPIIYPPQPPVPPGGGDYDTYNPQVFNLRPSAPPVRAAQPVAPRQALPMQRTPQPQQNQGLRRLSW